MEVIMPEYRALSCSGPRVRHADHGRWAISEDRHQYTTKCFEEDDRLPITLGYLGLTVAVGVWIIANLLARLV
jgi:hypothetical protein